ncbi:MAG: site-2 protease family protein [Ignavibacteria bacterium]|nr:site-2 protease family protein [Ignavibacteria bacterium]
MEEQGNQVHFDFTIPPVPPERNNYILHLILFIITFISCMFAGVAWISNDTNMKLSQFVALGFPYAFSMMFFLAAHELGHYFTARYHKLRVTLPYFIPFPPFAWLMPCFGTLGAVIRIKTYFPDRKSAFDVGIAGPLAGFVACLFILIYGFTHLPGINYLLAIHPDYYSPTYGKEAVNFSFGYNLLFWVMAKLFAGNGFIPPMSEVYHYPYLCIGWFGLFVTSMNLIPIGQLDGGHVTYAMFGQKRHSQISAICIILLIVLGVAGVLGTFFWPWLQIGWGGWLVWAGIVFFILKIHHPTIYDTEPLDIKRRVLGYIALAIFILSFTPAPFNIL